MGVIIKSVKTNTNALMGIIILLTIIIVTIATLSLGLTETLENLDNRIHDSTENVTNGSQYPNTENTTAGAAYYTDTTEETYQMSAGTVASE